MKVSELEGALLDYWVAKAEGFTPFVHKGAFYKNYTDERDACAKWAPSTDWEQGGPIIEREMIGVCRSYVSGWDGYVSFHRTKNGPTLLIAAMRSYVATKYGDEVPDMEAA